MYCYNIGFIRIKGKLSREYRIGKGLLTGSSLSPILWIIFFNDLLEKLNKTYTHGPLDNITIGTLDFADDLSGIIIDDNLCDGKKMIKDMSEMILLWAEENRMKVNFEVGKSEYTIINHEGEQIGDISLSSGEDLK